MLDDLRNSIDDDLGFDGEQDDGEEYEAYGIDFGDEQAQTQSRFLGMTAGERAFLAVMFFFNVLLLGVAVLIATGRIAI